jgi:hypothetical protein
MFYVVLAWVFFLALRGELPAYAALLKTSGSDPSLPAALATWIKSFWSSTIPGGAAGAGITGGGNPALGPTPPLSAGGLSQGLAPNTAPASLTGGALQ